MESRVIDEAASVLSARTPKLVNYSLLEPRRGDPGVCGGEVQIYLEPYMPPPTLLVIGAGHVGKAVVDLAHWLGYHTIAVDDRGDRLTAESMPHADERLEGSAADVLADVDVGPDTSVVVVSREMNIDVAAVSALIGSNPAYIGVMGSKRRWRAVRDRLIEEGVPSEAMEQISVPIGLELGAETVEEIAVSIMAEVIGVRRRSESSPAG